MIYPLLEEFAASGRWLGVYPQLTNSWRTVFPFTGPQLIHFRMEEFVQKKLKCLVGYATPSNRYYEFNVTAAAEWSWNSKGRTPNAFARVYGERKGISDSESYAEWACTIGGVGWDIAGSRVIETLISNPGRTLFGAGGEASGNLEEDLLDVEYGKGLLAEFPDLEHFEEAVVLAERALELAQREEDLEMIAESQSVLGALQLLEGLKAISDVKNVTKEERTAATESALEKIDAAAARLTRSLYEWGNVVNPVERGSLPSRYRDSVNVSSRVANLLRTIGDDLGLDDPHSQYRSRQIGEWTSKDFANSQEATIVIEITEFLDGPGEYDLTFEFLDGASGLTVNSVAILRGQSQEAAQMIHEERSGSRIGRWDRWVEFWLSVPHEEEDSAKENTRHYVKTVVSGPALDASSEQLMRIAVGYQQLKDCASQYNTSG